MLESDYPIDTPIGRKTVIDMHCDGCGTDWKTDGWTELGACAPLEDDGYICPKCGRVSD